MWRHWYGLAQAWGSTTYDWTLGQILPRSKEEGCQQNLTEPVTGKTRVYCEGNLTVEEYTYGITRRGIRPYGHLAQYRGWPETGLLGLASDCSTQSDCRRCLEDSTRVHRLGNWTGGEKRRSYPRVRGNGAASVTPARFFPPITYPTHRKKLAQRGDCRILRRCSVSPSPQLCRCLPKRRRAPTHGRRQHSWWSEPSPPGGTARLATGTPRRRPPLSSGPTSVWRQPSLSAALRGRQRAAQSFWRSGCGPRICAMLLRDTAMLRLDLPPLRAVLAGSPPDRGRAWWEP